MSKPMLDGKLMFPTQYLASEEFLDKDVTLVIKDVKIDNLQMSDGGAEDKPVLVFEKTDKKLVLNKTNAITIANLHGSEARDWAGKSITLYPTECQAFGHTVDCIRIRSNPPKTHPKPKPEVEPEQVKVPPASDTPSGGADIKKEVAWLQLVVQTEDFTLDNFRAARDLYQKTGLEWKPKWDELVQSKEFYTILPQMYEAIKEAVG